MLTLSNVGNGNAAARYYEAADDYYTGDRSPSAWWGQAASILGLAGPVESGQFADLLDGKLPTGETLHHGAVGRRGGTDATFSAPKSVSMQAYIGGDMRLVDAHQRAVDRALVHAEMLAGCRITQGRQTRSEPTNNLLVAKFEHDLSRACDPQIHTHCILLNVTQRHDGQWRALNNEVLYRQKMLLGALYRSELARESQALGYEVRITHLDGRFELSHIDDDHVRAFSHRSAAIEAYLQDQGKTRDEASAWVKKLAAVITRDQKTSVDRRLLRQSWLEHSRDLGIDYNYSEWSGRPVVSRETLQAVVTEAVAHLAEREAVFSRTDLLRMMMERAVGIATLDELEGGIDELLKSDLLIQCGDFYTTPAAQQRESEILDIEVRGRNSLISIYQSEKTTLLARLENLTDEQRNAALGVLLTRNQIMGIQGRAGVGKTTLLSVTADLAVSCGYSVRGLAPSASAAHGLSGTGISAETIAAFIARKHKALTSNTLLVLDEAGMTSTNQIHAVMSAVRDSGCRLVLIGDTSQLSAVEAGKPFAQLQNHGMATAVVGQIQRQKNRDLKKAVELAASGQVALAVEVLDKKITQIVPTAERFDRIAADYVALSQEERAQTLVIAGTRHARAEINSRIRDRLGLGEQGESFELLARKDLTNSQRRSTLSYQVGDVVQAEVNYPSLGLERGEFARVVGRKNHRILLERAGGGQMAWRPAAARQLTTYVPETRKLAIGDLVRVTANDHQRGLINGDLGKVIALDSKRRSLTLALPDGRTVILNGTKPLMLDYGYCSTVHAAQGKTCEQVLIEADSHSLTANQNSFYVAISRARQTAWIYTDDREMLPLAMSREYEKSSALELGSCSQQSHDLDIVA